MENKKEKTAPDVSVGADTEQPIFKNTTSSISENGGNIKSFEELQRESCYYSPITAYPGTPEYLYVDNSCQYLFEKSFRNF